MTAVRYLTPESWPCPRAWKVTAERKAAKSLDVLAEFFRGAERPYLAYSGGKDSSVVLDLCHRYHEADLRRTHVETVVTEEGWVPGIEELWAAAEERYGVTVHRFCAGSMFAWYRQWGLDDPDPVGAAWKGAVIAHQHELGVDGILRGLRADESRPRLLMLRRWGPIRRHREGWTMADPLAWWTARDIWAYHAACNLPYHRHYDDCDQANPRERRRIGEPFGAIGATHGRLWALKQWYPDIYRRFLAEFPEVAEYV